MHNPTLEECVVKVVKENREENCSQKTTYTSKGPDVTLRNTSGHKNSDVLSMPRATERIFQTWNFDPIPSESRNWPGSTCKELKNSSMMPSRSLRIFKNVPNQTIFLKVMVME